MVILVYNEKVMKEFRNPKNFGEMKNPDAVGKVGNIVCGDVMELYLRIGKNRKGEEIIKDIKIKTFGCVVAIANASILTKLAKGKTLEEASKINKNSILEKIGEVPREKIHCSLLAADALQDAIKNYRERQKQI